MQTKLPTLQTIAQHAHVAVSTVSLALRNDPRLPAQTRERIQSIARELGYRPNPSVSTLMAGIRRRHRIRHRETIAAVYPFPARLREAGDPYFEGATERADQLGFQLEPIWAKEEGLSGRRLSAILHARNIRGVLIWPVEAARGHVSLDWPGFAAAAMGYSIWKPDLHRAVENHYQNVVLALRTLWRRGYRRIGLAMNAKTDERVDRLNTAGYYVFRERLPQRNRVEPFLTCQFDQKHFASWFEKEHPDVVIGNAPAIPTWIRQCGKRIPEDVSFAQIQLEKGPAACAGVRQNQKDVGAAGVDLVVDQLHHNETGIPTRPKLVLVRGEWIEGETVRQPKG